MTFYSYVSEPTAAPMLPEIGSPTWWLDRLLLRLDARQGRSPGTRAATTRGGSATDDAGSPGMALYEAYYKGSHRQTYKIRKVISAFGLEMPLFVNYCGVVVDVLAERLGVVGFNFHNDDKASAAADEIWQANNLDAGFSRGIRAGLVKGEFSLSVWPDETGEPRICVEDAAEVIVAVDPADHRRRRAALKRWTDEDEGSIFATLYLPDGIYKYRADIPTSLIGSITVTPAGGRSWRPRLVAGEEWPLPNPFGEVPVFPIPNKPDSRGTGTSELSLVVPIQDAINANVANVMLAGLYGAFRQRFAVNVKLTTNPETGEPESPWNIAEDSLITAPPLDDPSKSTEFGEFGQTELSGYISLHETLVQSVATTQRFPPHYLLGSQGTFPSGESLTAAERGLAEKARERGLDIKDPTEDAMRFAFKVKAAQDGASATARGRYSKWADMTSAAANMKDPETRTESQHVDALIKLYTGLDLPWRAVVPMLPATPEEVRQWSEWRDEDAEAEAARTAALPPPPAPPGGAVPPAAGATPPPAEGAA